MAAFRSFIEGFIVGISFACAVDKWKVSGVRTGLTWLTDSKGRLRQFEQVWEFRGVPFYPEALC